MQGYLRKSVPPCPGRRLVERVASWAGEVWSDPERKNTTLKIKCAIVVNQATSNVLLCTQQLTLENPQSSLSPLRRNAPRERERDSVLLGGARKWSMANSLREWGLTSLWGLPDSRAVLVVAMIFSADSTVWPENSDWRDKIKVKRKNSEFKETIWMEYHMTYKNLSSRLVDRGQDVDTLSREVSSCIGADTGSVAPPTLHHILSVVVVQLNQVTLAETQECRALAWGTWNGINWCMMPTSKHRYASSY